MSGENLSSNNNNDAWASLMNNSGASTSGEKSEEPTNYEEQLKDIRAGIARELREKKEEEELFKDVRKEIADKVRSINEEELLKDSAEVKDSSEEVLRRVEPRIGRIAKMAAEKENPTDSPSVTAGQDRPKEPEPHMQGPNPVPDWTYDEDGVPSWNRNEREEESGNWR